MSERILRKTTTHEIIQRSFTTERKHARRKTTINISRKGSIVKERCRQLTEIALNLYPERRIDTQDLTFLITSNVGGDKATVRAYMGYNGYVKHSTTGNMSVVLGQKKKGYLETFNFMHRDKQTWVIHAQATLNPPVPPLSLVNESIDATAEPIEKISLSHLSSSGVERGNGGKPGTVTSGCPPLYTTKKYNNNNTERERNFTPKIYGKRSSRHGS